MKIYIAIDKKGKPVRNFQPECDPGCVFRALAEYGYDLKKYDVAQFNLKNFKPNKILLGTKSDYYEVDEDEDSL